MEWESHDACSGKHAASSSYCHHGRIRKLGLRAFWKETGHWIQCSWCGEWQHTPIHAKELLPIILTVATWGPHWCSSRIQVHTSKDKLIMHLLRSLHFVSAFYNIQVAIQHIAGVDNTIADSISLNNLQVFLNHAPRANPELTPIPAPLWSILVTQQPDWLSVTWQASLTTSLEKVSRQTQGRLIPPLKRNT